MTRERDGAARDRLALLGGRSQRQGFVDVPPPRLRPRCARLEAPSVLRRASGASGQTARAAAPRASLLGKERR